MLESLTSAITKLKNGENPLASDVLVNSDRRIDRTDQCKVIWYQWAYELPTNDKNAFGFRAALASAIPASLDDSTLSASRAYDISNHIENLIFKKNIGDASGTFSFTLYKSFDWIRFMKAGSWVCIYLSGDGSLPLPTENTQTNTLNIGTLEGDLRSSLSGSPTTALRLPIAGTGTIWAPYRRCVGLIQRVSVKSSTNIDGTVETSYVVTGKDYGAIYEETELWFNMHNADESTFSSKVSGEIFQTDRNLASLLDIIHDIFLDTQKYMGSTTINNVGIPRQWLLPDKLVQDLGLTGAHYFGDITTLKNFRPTLFQNPTPTFIDGLAGRCWDRMKSFSQPEFHELFTELNDDGQPEITFRPIPWALDTKNYPTIASFMYKYSDLYKSPGSIPTSLPVSLNSFKNSLISQGFARALSSNDTRKKHSLALTPAQVDSYDVGPDQHSRSNFFIVDSIRSAYDQKNAFAIVNGQKASLPFTFPFRDENDIKRHGFKPIVINLTSFNVTPTIGNLFNKTKDLSQDAAFILEANHLVKDFYANAEDMYSGTINLSTGLNSVKLGKVIVTDVTFAGINDMVFYLEGYEDIFNVNNDGTCTWSQVLQVTRGLPKSVLDGAQSSKVGIPTSSSTFHAFNKNEPSADGGLKSAAEKLGNEIKGLF